MKKILSMVILVLVTQFSFAQYFKLTPKGFVYDDNSDFMVVNVSNVKKWICTKMFSMPLIPYTEIHKKG